MFRWIGESSMVKDNQIYCFDCSEFVAPITLVETETYIVKGYVDGDHEITAELTKTYCSQCNTELYIREQEIENDTILYGIRNMLERRQKLLTLNQRGKRLPIYHEIKPKHLHRLGGNKWRRSILYRKTNYKFLTKWEPETTIIWCNNRNNTGNKTKE